MQNLWLEDDHAGESG